MATNLPVGNARYSFSRPQQYAMQLRLTPEVRDALLKAQQTGQAASLRLTGTGSDNAIVVGSQSFALHPPIAQERLDVFTQSKQGCVQVGQIHQKAVVKRATMQALSKQPVAAQASQAQQTGPPHTAHRPAAGSVQNGRTLMPSGQKPAAQQRQLMAPPQTSRAPPAAASAGLAKQTAANRQALAPKQPSIKPPPPSSGAHPSWQHPAAAQSHPSAPPSSQHAPSGVSNLSAQTALAAKPPKGKAGKAASKGQGKAPGSVSHVSAQQPGVMQLVHAAADISHKAVMLVALHLCRPCKDRVLEDVLKDTEKKVPNFNRLQGDYFKRSCRQYANMVSGSAWVLKENFLQEAKDLVGSLSSPAEGNIASAQLAQPSAVAAKRSSAEPETAEQRQKCPELQRRHHTPEPQGMDGGLPEAQPAQGADKGKKKKRLTKAADMDKPHQGSDINKSSGAGVKRKMQAAGLTDSESGEDSSAAHRQRKAHKGPSGSRPPAHNGTYPTTTAAGPGPQLQHQPAHLNGHAEQQHHHSQGERWQDGSSAGGDRAGSLGAAGRSASLEAPMTDGDRGQAAAAAPSVGKIKLKLRRPWSAGAEEYDESWFAGHVDRQPTLRGPITHVDQWEEYLEEYNSKHGLYFRLHQEILDTKVKVEGLQQAIHKAGSDTEKAKYEQQFVLMWQKRLPRSQKWDKAFAVLHKELEALHNHLQAFHDQHAAGA